MRNNFKFVALLIIIISIPAIYLLTSKPQSGIPKQNTQKATDTIRESQVKKFKDNNLHISFEYPADWFGPEVYNYENGLRIEIGTDKVYPYGTNPSERIYTKENNYFTVIQLDKKPADIPADEYKKTNYVLTQLQVLNNLKPNESVTTSRSITTKIRDININGFTGAEYTTTLSDTAQTDLLYSREVLLVNKNYDTLTIRGYPDNVLIDDKSNWKKYYSEIDNKYSNVLSDIVKSTSF